MKVLLVEDSRVVAAYVRQLVQRFPEIDLMPVVDNGLDAVSIVAETRPDVVLMDLQLPKLDGVEAIRRIMEQSPVPIVVMSAYVGGPRGNRTFESLRAGAVDVLPKPQGLSQTEVRDFGTRLMETLRACMTANFQARRQNLTNPVLVSGARVADVELVLIGSSTGGPPLLWSLFSGVPVPFRTPIVVGQHLVEGFDHSLAQWLSGTGHDVRVAVDGEPLVRERVYVVPSDRHMAITDGRFHELPRAAAVPVPNIDKLFQSVARQGAARVAAMLLTGMGRDGADGLLALRKSGALTIAQSGETCVVDGMPKAARALEAAERVLGPDELRALLQTIHDCGRREVG